jgi:maltodextrin utilization protein YvdJ
MESGAKRFFINRFTLSGIFAARTVKRRFIALQLVFVSLILAFPLSIGIFNLDHAMVLRSIFTGLTDEAGISDMLERAMADKKQMIHVTEDGREALMYMPNAWIVAHDNPGFEKLIELTDDSAIMYMFGMSFIGAIGELQTGGDAADILAGLVWMTMNEMYALLSLLMYPLTLILNVIFILAVSGLTLFLNYSTVVRLTYREFFALICYAATIPALAALLLGTFLSVAFVYLTYNFGAVIWAYIVFKKGQSAAYEMMQS